MNGAAEGGEQGSSLNGPKEPFVQHPLGGFFDAPLQSHATLKTREVPYSSYPTKVERGDCRKSDATKSMLCDYSSSAQLSLGLAAAAILSGYSPSPE